jgi:hypothetical protein
MAPKRTLDSLDSSEPVVCRKPLYHAPSPTGSGDTPRKSKKRKTQTSMNQSPNDLTKQQNFNLSNFIDLTEMESVPPRSRAPRKSKHFRFMDLPAELRREVYQHLLPNGMRISFHWRYPRNSNDESHPNCINGQIWYMKSTDKEGRCLRDGQIVNRIR